LKRKTDLIPAMIDGSLCVVRLKPTPVEPNSSQEKALSRKHGAEVLTAVVVNRWIWAVLVVAAMASAAGCSRPGEDEIARTKKKHTPSEVRSAILPLFVDYHYDPTAPDYGHPNYTEVSALPPRIAALPLFSAMTVGQKAVIGALKADTNALIIFTQVGMDKWGVVVHRDATATQLPSDGVETFSLWSEGVFFFRGSSMP
jgi:hypothetical protein